MYLRQSTIQAIRFGPFLDIGDGVTEEVSLTITPALRRLSKDGAAFGAASGAVNSTHDSDGWYTSDLSAADTDTVGELILNVQVPTTHLPVWMRWWVIEETVYDRFYGASAGGYLQATVPANTLDVTAAGEAGLDLDNTVGTLDAAQFGADFLTSAKIADDAFLAINFAANSLDGKGDWNINKTGYALTTADWNVGKTGYSVDTLATDSVDAAALSTDAVDEIVDQVWDELLAGHVIVDSAGLLLNEWQDGGRLDVILDTLALEATVGGLNNISTSDVLTQINTALDTVISELAVTQPATTPTLRTAVMLLYMVLRNRTDTFTSGTDALRVYRDDGTIITTKALSDDGDDYSEAKMA